MEFKLELVVVPVSDVDRAKAFYADKMGFTVDVDHAPSEHFRVVQLTPPGSACSITIGTGLTKSEPGSSQGPELAQLSFVISLACRYLLLALRPKTVPTPSPTTPAPSAT